MISAAEIQEAIKSGKAVTGYRRSVRYLKFNHPKLIVMAKNMEEKMRKGIEENTSDSKVEIFEGTSRELGIMCGKPFPISIVVIK